MGCPHWCADEMAMVVAAIGGVRLIGPWLKGLWANRHKKPNCKHEGGH